jgi:hypothetical protein
MAREKLRVARVERNMPRRRREKDLIRLYWCGVVGVVGKVVRRWERAGGRRVLRRAKVAKRGVRVWSGLAVCSLRR